MKDRLAWWEEIPLGLALVAQSYVVGLWYYASVSGAAWWLDLLVAVGAGLALDLIVVTTVMGRRQGRSSGWSWATSFGAFLCSSLIALDRYGWEPRSLLHVAFPLVVFLYSQHLAAHRKIALEALPERSSAPERAELPTDAATSPQAISQAPALMPTTNGQGHASEPLEALVLAPHQVREPEAPRYRCPHCDRPLGSKQAVGAAVKNGYCLGCKSERKAA